MRIGFTGAQGTGKTMVANGLKQDPLTKAFFFPPSSARMFSGAGVNTDATPLAQFMITVDRATNIIRHEDVISDRTAIDSWAYTEYQLMRHWKADDIPVGYVSVTNQYVDYAMGSIDWLFYFPPYWAPEEDGIRSGDREYQLEIDDLIQHGIYKFYPRTEDRLITMPNVSVEERVKLVLDHIES